MKSNMKTNYRAEFRTWFHRKWAEWDAREGVRTTQQELADYLDIARSAVAQYASGRQTPDGENLRKIALKFGLEVYEILGKPRPNLDPLDLLPLNLRVRLGRAAYQLDKYLKENSIPKNSPEAESKAIEIFSSEFNQSKKE